MTEADRALAANRSYQPPAGLTEARPARGLAVVTCMDTRIDVLAALGLALGEAHVLRNAGGRVTDDVLRSLAISVRMLGVHSVIVMQHTRCGLAGTTDEELRARTGADVAFLPIADHRAALEHDVDLLARTPYLSPVREIAGFVYDVDSGRVEDVCRPRGGAGAGRG